MHCYSHDVEVAAASRNISFEPGNEGIGKLPERVIKDIMDSWGKYPKDLSKDFKSELRSIINRCSMENGSNTPDFILATYLVKCLENFEMAVGMRDSWYGVELKPGCSATNNAPKAGDPVGELEELLDRRY
jgi:hypothetical protein